MQARAVEPSTRRLLLYLVVLATVLPEGITGATPPWKWIDPVQLLLVFSLYGPGVLLVREASIRWRAGWPGILLLGAAYGIVEEGLAVKTFFDAGLPMLGTLGWYGRWLDVNWVWAVWLSLFHASFSIAFPIFLVEWRWPAIRGRSLLSGRGVFGVAAILALAATFDHAFLTPYRPGVPQVAGAVLAVAVLAWLARRRAGDLWRRLPSGRVLPRKVYAAAGFLFWGLSFLAYAGGPSLGGHPLVSVLQGGVLLAVVLLLLRRVAGTPEARGHAFAFVAGSIGFFAVWAVLMEFAGIRGMSAVGVGFVALVLWLDRNRGDDVGTGLTGSAPSRAP